MAPQTVTLEDLFFSFTEGDAVERPAAGAADDAPSTTPVAR
jgi:hypothetical protein